MQQTLTGLLDDLIAAWNRGDAAIFASLFSVDADYVTGSGIWLHGRPAIAELLRPDAPLPQVRVEGEAAIREYGSVGSIIFRWATQPGAEPQRRGVVTCLVVQSDAGWLIHRLHNTDET